jgi:hypothetical protein
MAYLNINSKKCIILETPEITNDAYLIAREAYKTSEYIPVQLIDILMTHHFMSSELILSYNDNHRVYKIQIKDLLVDSVVNWKYNRPPDMARLPDIARYIYNSQEPIDSMIYMSFNNLNNIFEVYDGIHRLKSLKLIKEENSKESNLITPGEFGSNNDAEWIYNQYMIVNIRFNAKLGDLFEAFKNLNKCQTVPDVYFRDSKREKKDLIESIANDWYVRYKAHFTSTNNPNTGHTNRNKFIELLDKLYDKYKIDEMNKHVLQEVLDIANSKIGENLPAKLTKKMISKCSETGCYLFLYKNDILEYFI